MYIRAWYSIATILDTSSPSVRRSLRQHESVANLSNRYITSVLVFFFKLFFVLRFFVPHQWNIKYRRKVNPLESPDRDYPPPPVPLPKKHNPVSNSKDYKMTFLTDLFLDLLSRSESSWNRLVWE